MFCSVVGGRCHHIVIRVGLAGKAVDLAKPQSWPHHAGGRVT